MQATCRNCRNSWELQKEPGDYADGPRCSDCQSREVAVKEPDRAHDNTAIVFDALAEGADLIELVRENGVDPDDAEALAGQFARLSAYHLVHEDELSERIERARWEVRQEADRRIQQLQAEISELHDEVTNLCDEVDRAYSEGFAQGEGSGRKKAYERARTEVDAQMAEIKEVVEELIETARKRGRAEGKMEGRTEFVDTLEAMENEEIVEVYLEGLRHGTIIGFGHGAEVGRKDGMRVIAEAMEG